MENMYSEQRPQLKLQVQSMRIKAIFACMPAVSHSSYPNYPIETFQRAESLDVGKISCQAYVNSHRLDRFTMLFTVPFQ